MREEKKPIIALDIGPDNPASSSTKILSTSKTSCQIHRRPKAPKEQARKGINKTKMDVHTVWKLCKSLEIKQFA